MDVRIFICCTLYDYKNPYCAYHILRGDCYTGSSGGIWRGFHDEFLRFRKFDLRNEALLPRSKHFQATLHCWIARPKNCLNLLWTKISRKINFYPMRCIDEEEYSLLPADGAILATVVRRRLKLPTFCFYLTPVIRSSHLYSYFQPNLDQFTVLTNSISIHMRSTANFEIK